MTNQRMANGRNRSYSSAFRVRGASSPRSNEPLRKPSHAARQRQLRQHNPAQARLVLARSVPNRQRVDMKAVLWQRDPRLISVQPLPGCEHGRLPLFFAGVAVEQTQVRHVWGRWQVVDGACQGAGCHCVLILLAQQVDALEVYFAPRHLVEQDVVRRQLPCQRLGSLEHLLAAQLDARQHCHMRWEEGRAAVRRALRVDLLLQQVRLCAARHRPDAVRLLQPSAQVALVHPTGSGF
mmetsp:Transcript_13318/g.38694  ORF Transcript_13318/g.38694 Transcript_13318/m.38694 type:complete len:237 (-) Transcript_13318:310-1020(-)